MKLQIYKSECFLVAILLLVFIIRNLDYISKKSATYDEPYHISRGYPTLVSGDYRLRGYNVFLVPFLSAIPLAFTNVYFSTDNKYWQEAAKTFHSWNFALDFFYRNRLPHEKILFLSRLVIVFIGIFLLLLIFIQAKEVYGTNSALVSLFFASFCPNIIAHSGLVTEDLPVSFFIFLSVYFFRKYLIKPDLKNSLLTGVSFALAQNTKHSALLLLPIFFIILIFKFPLIWPYRKILLVHVFGFLLAAFAIFCLLYRIFFLKEYLMSIKVNIPYLSRGQMSFLLGRYSPKGFPDYFLIAFLIKTSIPILILLILGLFLRIKEKIYWFFPPVFIILVSSLSVFQIGHRHILPAYPFLFVLCGGIGGRLMKTKVLKGLLIVLCLFHGFSSISIHPHYLSYCNELVGGAKNGYKFLVDSNIDWGQDLKGLEEYIQKNPCEVILSYYGTSIPEAIKFKFQDLYSFGIWGRKEHVNSLDVGKEILAISVTNLQGLYLGKIGHNVFKFLEKKKPIEFIGYSILVYDISDDFEVHERLAHIYFFTGQFDKAFREAKRAILLNPKSPFAHLVLSFLYLNTNQQLKAFEHYKIAVEIDPELKFDYEQLLETNHSRKIYMDSFSQIAVICKDKNFSLGAKVADFWVSYIGNL